MRTHVLSVKLLIVFMIVLSLWRMPPTCKAQLLGVTVYTNKISYVPDENLTIYGNLTFQGNPVEENGLVGLQLNDPESPVFLRTVKVGPFTRNPLVNILSVSPCDFYMNPKSIFERGEEAYFRVVVKNYDVVPRDVLITVSVFEGSGRSFGVPSTFRLTMDPGAVVSARFGPVTIPVWAKSGEAGVYANVFSDWPSNHGTPYCPEKSAVFTIAGLEGDCSEGSFEYQSSSSNSYELRVKLSPESRSGQYRVHASANYLGHSAYSTRTFTVPSGPYPPKAYFEYVPYPESWVGANMTFDASTSVALGYGDRITKYKWNFGDGTIVEKTTPKITKVYNSAGTFTVTLNVTDNEGFWNAVSKNITVLTEKRDIAITKLESLTEIYADWLVNVTFTVKNLGGPNPATFNVKIMLNETVIHTYSVTNLAPWPNGVLTITHIWNTAGLTPYVRYILKVEAEALEREVNTENNVLSLLIKKVKMLGDVDGDKDIDIYDVVSVTSRYNSKLGDPNWNVQADLIRNNIINIYDVVAVAGKYGTRWPS